MEYLLLRLATDYERFPNHEEAGLKQLHVHGLVDDDFVRHFDRPELRFVYNEKGVLARQGGDLDSKESDQENDIGLSTTPPEFSQPPRGREESMEERQLRRRRREAMVIGGQGRPFALADTLQHTAGDSEDSVHTRGGIEPEAEPTTVEEAVGVSREAFADQHPAPEGQGTPSVD